MNAAVLQIEAVSGPLRGNVWHLSEAPLVFGRSVGCHIRLSDPLASRRHCEVWLEHGQVCLRDLGSSNAIFVNGRPVRLASLSEGDEFSLGASVFRVVPSIKEDLHTASVDPSPTPATLSPVRDAYLRHRPGNEALSTSPRTIEELHALFTLSRTFSMESTLVGLWECLNEHLRRRFKPVHVWLATYLPIEDSLLLHPSTNPPDGAKEPRDWMKQAILEKHAALFPRFTGRASTKALETTMIAPISSATDVVGVAALHTHSPQGVYDENDLEYLLAVTSTFAPFVRMAERREQLQRDQAYRSAQGAPTARLVGESKPLVELREITRRAAQSRLPVLLEGESGTGKELIARMIHDLSARAAQPYVALNCAAIPSELFESEMFGHERGAFTGAHARRIGRFEEAHSGTLFLDEIADCSKENQARMLRVLETGRFRRVGGREEVAVDTRIVCASNKDLLNEVNSGNFRQDLYYRLSGFVVKLPPLRELTGDIPRLANHFLAEACQCLPKGVTGISEEAMQLLQSWHWPGNGRELRATIERAVLIAKDPLIAPCDIAIPGLTAPLPGSGYLRAPAVDPAGTVPTLQEVERQHIQYALERCEGKVRAAARLLGISHVTLYARIKEYGLQGEKSGTESGVEA
ncbi:MAG: sigma 54-interacting transcriptional regulator [Candidatus Hydrogenedentes bacterium]|nr:sigma 54-interacting transcriptional regulator [Candidatus Hydrogenedentota bacterium]